MYLECKLPVKTLGRVRQLLLSSSDWRSILFAISWLWLLSVTSFKELHSHSSMAQCLNLYTFETSSGSNPAISQNRQSKITSAYS